jgi:hypothetical protein
MARNLIAIMEDVDPGSFEVDVRFILPKDVRLELDKAASLRETAACAQAEAARLARRAAWRLHELGLPMRDAGRVLGVSGQRAQQLVKEADSASS